jgi:SNF2 family DNA or RNA helicase
MARLEELTKGALVRGVLGDRVVRVVDVAWHGSSAVTLTYTDEATGRADQDLLYREDEPRLTVEQSVRAWSMDADGQLFRLVSEAKRISLAYLFDPFLAVQTSNLDPLPHQIDAVYGQMLPRQPLRYLLADDPGAGKTIMAGLFCKELMVRGDVERCLVIAPGSLVEQWQDELWEKFGLQFEILTRDMIEAARSGNPFVERPLLIARLDHLARNEDLQAKLAATDWDLVIVDEAHKMSAHRLGGEVRETRRYKLGRLAGSITRHFLLMTATPHAGIEEDFQLFLALLDSDRFEGRSRDASHFVDTSDLMRRLVKEKLLKFDGTPLFPERRAYTAIYPLSDNEALLYKLVTEYVQEEMNRAERLRAAGEGRRGAIVGFALTTLQRRLASSPEAIYQSLRRRRQRLEHRVAEERIRRRADEIAATLGTPAVPPEFRAADDDFDADDLPDGELEDLEEEMVDQASAAQTIAELEHEIKTLGDLEELASQIRNSGQDRKWEELADLLREAPEMFDANGNRRKLIILSEHRDTLGYLVGKLRNLLGASSAVVAIHGGLPREERRKVQEAFVQDSDVRVLVATDAAGEGINLQRAHLMINYDLPWNPNRIEQRFGRVHRIGQTEVCHLWNLVAEDTREGQVFQRLFEKLDEQRNALGDQVFDVLGEAFRGKSLRDLLIEAVRYGEQPDRQVYLTTVVDETVGERLRYVVHQRALVSDVMTAADVERIRDEMERAEARSLQPLFTQSLFLAAFEHLSGSLRTREAGRFEITKVPAEMRRRDRQVGLGAPLMAKYERVTFDKGLITAGRAPHAEYIAPGHPLLDAAMDLITERYESLLRQGAVLVDDADLGDTPRVLVYLQHAVVDDRTDGAGGRRTVSKRFQFVEVDRDGNAREAGWAPYLDMRPAATHEMILLRPVIEDRWVRSDIEEAAFEYGVALSRAHLDEVRRRVLDRVDRVTEAVRRRLEGEIQYWDHRASQLREQELAGRLPGSGMNSARARQRVDDLQARLRHRLRELDAERLLSSVPPVVSGGALVIPAGLLAAIIGEGDITGQAAARAAAERAALDGVMAIEKALGRVPAEMSRGNPGYDIESKDADGNLVFIKVKTRAAGADSLTVTRTDVAVGRNKPGRHILALAQVQAGSTPVVRYVRGAFDGIGDLPLATSTVSLSWSSLAERSEIPW